MFISNSIVTFAPSLIFKLIKISLIIKTVYEAFFTTVSALLLASMSSLAAEVVPYVHDFNDADCLQEWSVLCTFRPRPFLKYAEAHQAPVYGYRNCVCSNSIYSGGSIETKDS